MKDKILLLFKITELNLDSSIVDCRLNDFILIFNLRYHLLSPILSELLSNASLFELFINIPSFSELFIK